MSLPTIDRIKKGFNDFLMRQVFAQYQVSYCKTSNQIHPTKLTLADGSPRAEIDASDVGVQHQEGSTPYAPT
jgi:restriction endonuclease